MENLAPRTIEVPPDLERALAAAGERLTFDAMSFSHRREWIAAIGDAKRPETREKRIRACVEAMRERRRARATVNPGR